MILLALLIGVVAGLRSMIAPAAIAWAAGGGALALGGTWLGWIASPITAWIFTLLALGELVTDQLPSTPSRKVPIQFGGRILSGALCGAAIGIDAGQTVLGLAAGAIGAVIGTLGGAAARGRLATAFGRDLPAALIEDAVAIAGAALIAAAL